MRRFREALSALIGKGESFGARARSMPRPENHRASWADRSSLLQDSLESVLFKRFPPELNQYIDRWHKDVLRRELQGMERGADLAVLDVGCGYGRLAEAIRECPPGARVVGIDISPTYAALFARRGAGSPVLASAAALPFSDSSFDVIICVTVLMYAPPPDLQRTFREFLRCLKPNGRLLLIENSVGGYNLYTCFRVLPAVASALGLRRSSASAGEGHIFSRREIPSLCSSSGAAIVRREGITAFTALLPVFQILSTLRLGFAYRFLLKFLHGSPFLPDWSLHTFCRIEKEASGADGGAAGNAARGPELAEGISKPVR